MPSVCALRPAPAFLLAALLSLLFWGVATRVSAAVPDQETIESLAAEAEASPQLTEEQRARIVGMYHAALTSLAERDRHLAEAEETRQLQLAAEPEIERLQDQVRSQDPTPPPGLPALPDTTDTETIQARISTAQGLRQDIQERASALQADIEGAPARASRERDRLLEVGRQLLALQPGTNANAAAGPASKAQAILALARRAALEAEEQSLRLSIDSEVVRNEVAYARRARLSQFLEMVDERLTVLASMLAKASTKRAEAQIDAARALAQRATATEPSLASIGDTNIDLAQRAKDLEVAALDAEAEASVLAASRDRLSGEFQSTRQWVELGGHSPTLGQVLITQRERIPDIGALQHDIRLRDVAINEAALNRFALDDELRQMNNGGAWLDQTVPNHKEWQDESRALLQELVQQRITLLRQLLGDYDRLLHQLAQTNASARDLNDIARQFDRFLEGNLLWVRAILYLDADQIGEQLASLLSPKLWLGVTEHALGGIRNYPGLVFGLLLSAVLLARHRWLRQRLTAMTSQARTASQDTIGDTLTALAITLALTLPIPFLVITCGLTLVANSEAPPQIIAVGHAISALGKQLAFVLTVLAILEPNGVGRRSLRWNAKVIEAFRAETRWLATVTLPAGTLATYTLYDSPANGGGPLGTASIVVLFTSVFLAAFHLYSVPAVAKRRLLKAWMLVAMLASLSMLVLELSGFLFASDLVAKLLMRSLGVVSLVYLVGEYCERALLILRYRVKTATRAVADTAAEEVPVSPQLPDVEALSASHEKLLRTLQFIALLMLFLWIWEPLLPGLSMLDSVVLWTVQVAGEDGNITQAISLANVAIAALVLALTVLAYRHLPSLFQVLLLDRIHTTAGGRYAVSALVQYFIIAVGIVSVLSTLGMRWSQLQWLAAALSVGIGFGLQEIVANFISGLIILFEKPIRVGDIVSLDSAEGTVKKINIRATVIETFDRKELVVPNKDFITGRLLNWSLTDTVLRLMIEVGIAYGSDVRKAIELITDAAEEHPDIMPEPKPITTFDNFGDNALVLTLRCFTPSVEKRVVTATALRNTIYDRLTAAGIVIAFPQRDVHVDFSGPLHVASHPQP